MGAIDTILIANRGEIACRIARTCRRMGIRTVAVFSDADEASLHVRACDEAVRIGAAPAAESYLRVDRIVEAARRAGADAVHPGYGFLAENADFAQACVDAGLVFIGPSADAIRAMGSKQRAKRIAADAGVPVIPGYDGADQDPATLAREAARVGYPVLVKASAGGGGKGMRVVREPSGIEAALASARREAQSAFGDGTLLIERYLERPRHVEIQILGDAHGHLVHLFERECTIQRRHQKIVEESPSPAVDDALRARMGEAALRVAGAIGYVNAGTVELILTPDGEFFFLEVNTRLQVEHPVTEAVTGLDLVAEQIRVARGEPLGYGQTDLRLEGAAVEVRLYAEDPERGFLPATGELVDFHVPSDLDVRVDTGVERGAIVGIHYDPLLAKVVCAGRDRAEALAKTRLALSRMSVAGVTTNRELLVRVLGHPDVRAGSFDTHFVETHAESLRADPTRPGRDVAAVAAALASRERRRATSPVLPHLSPGFRNNPSAWQWVEYEDGPRVEYDGAGPVSVRVDGVEHRATVHGWDGVTLDLELDGRRRRRRVVFAGDTVHVHCVDGAHSLVERPRFPAPGGETSAGGCTAPMPGTIVQVNVEAGQTVEAGQSLVVMEAMKMEHTVHAPRDGVVESVRVEVGDQVDGDALLVVIVDPAEVP